MRLPKITLRKYSGDPAEWTSFWDSYQSSIHHNPDLSDIDKFNYLRSLLEHTALDSITGLTNSSANYQQAIDIIHKRFGNRQVIISKHMDVLLNLHAVQADHHLRDLRRLYDTTESHVRSLKSLGIESTTYGALFSSVLLTKLPPDLRLIVSRKVPSSNLLATGDRKGVQMVRRACGYTHKAWLGTFRPVNCNESEGNSTNCAITHVLCSKGYSENLSLNTQLNAFWELEALGIQEEEKTVYDEYTTAIHFENGRYKIPLPWKEFHEPLPSHYDLSLRRLQSLLRQLMRKPAILKEYSATIAEQQKLGIIELVSKEEPTRLSIIYPITSSYARTSPQPRHASCTTPQQKWLTVPLLMIAS